MKKIGLVAVLLGLCINVFADNIDHAQLAQETKTISANLGKLILLPNQQIQCAVLLTKGSGQAFAGSRFLKYKSVKLAKKAIEQSIQTLSLTDVLGCAGKEQIIKAEADLMAIDSQL